MSRCAPSPTPAGGSCPPAGPQLRAAAALGPSVMLGALCAMSLGIVLGSLLDGRDRILRDELVQRWPVQPAKSTGPAGPVGDAQLRQSGNSKD